MGNTVIGIFENTSEAYEAIDMLTSSGFSRNDIDISENDDYDRENTGDNYEEEDGISKFFNNLFGNNDRAKSYSEVSRRSRCIVTVHAQSTEEAHQASSILDDYGAVDVDERAAEFGYNTDYNKEDDYDTENWERSDTDSGESRSIPIIDEEMHVGKRDVVTGGVRIRSRIINKPVEETLRLRHERLTVERTPVNRPATESDMRHFKDGEIEATERSEVPVVNKEARVVEEIKLKKEVDETQETIRENVRKTEVDIDDHHDKDVRNRGRSDDDYSNRNREL